MVERSLSINAEKFTFLLPVTKSSQTEFFCATLTAAAAVYDNEPRRGTISLRGEDRTGGNATDIPFRRELTLFSPLMLVEAIANIQ